MMPFSSYRRKVVGAEFAATPLGKLVDVDLPKGAMISFDVNPAMCRRRDKVIFEWLGASFTAPGWLVQEKTEPIDSTMVS
jgi:hypothetical protein